MSSQNSKVNYPHDHNTHLIMDAMKIMYCYNVAYLAGVFQK